MPSKPALADPIGPDGSTGGKRDDLRLTGGMIDNGGCYLGCL